MPGARTIAASSVPAAAIPEPEIVGMSPRFHRLTVADVRRETGDAVSIAFATPPHLAADYRFSAGQYLTIRTTLEGEEVRRSYSLCCGPDDGELRIAVKRVESGLFSSWINAGLRVGDELDVMTPTGRFGLSNSLGDGRIHVAFFAGSG